jgi:3-hydroxyacyl-CoA dehydrogenase
MSSLILTETRGRVRVVLVNNPPVNALSRGVIEGLLAAVETSARDPDVDALVIGATGRTFIAGADITLLEQLAWGDLSAKPDLRPLLTAVERCAKPVVMAIHGTALGGGLEFAMAGHFRVAVPDAQVGQPEVNLGIIPGAEGTQRLPRLAGIEKALELCVTGRPITAPAALAAGILDQLIEGDLIDGAVRFAASAAVDGRARPVTSDRRDRLGTPAENAPLVAAARALARKIRPHQTAPGKAIDAIEAAADLPFAEGSARETELFLEAVASDQAKAMIHLFFAERAVARVPGVTPATAARPVARVAIVGAGTMGGGIAMACANAGLDVRLREVSAEALDAGLQAIRRNYDISVSRGRLTPEAAGERLARIHPQVDAAGFAEADLIVEAVFEDMALKQQVFRELDQLARPGCVLATNTSTLSIDEIASATTRPGDVVGLHFFSPAAVMRLVEIVRGRVTSPDVIATALALARRLRKIGVVVGNGPGFVGNRMMLPYMYETQFLVEEGATPEQVDRALTDFGMAMGMFAVDDMAGLDVAWRARRALGHHEGPGRKPLVQDRLVSLGRLGQKTGRGWYRYEDGRTPLADPEVIELIRTEAAAAGIVQRSIAATEIVERSIYTLVNEGARVLGAGLAARASDIDVIYASGYGFPAWRGGPMFHADRVGLDHVLGRIRTFHQTFGDRWAPAPLLEELAAEGTTFREWDRRD